MAKDADDLSVNPVRAVGVCENSLSAVLHHAPYYCGFFRSVWDLDLKLEKCCYCDEGAAGG